MIAPGTGGEGGAELPGVLVFEVADRSIAFAAAGVGGRVGAVVEDEGGLELAEVGDGGVVLPGELAGVGLVPGTGVPVAFELDAVEAEPFVAAAVEPGDV